MSKTLVCLDYSDEDSGFGHFVAKLFALAFVPAFLILAVYQHIKTRMPPLMSADVQVQEFMHYYERTWLFNPSVPLEVWSVFDRNDQSKRTSNDLEGKDRYAHLYSRVE